jgi:hypothetical protein
LRLIEFYLPSLVKSAKAPLESPGQILLAFDFLVKSVNAPLGVYGRIGEEAIMAGRQKKQKRLPWRRKLILQSAYIPRKPHQELQSSTYKSTHDSHSRIYKVQRTYLAPSQDVLATAGQESADTSRLV